MVASAQDVLDRNAAEALKGARIFVPRSSFPTAATDEYYWVDLMGLNVLNREIAESPTYARAWSNLAVIHYKQGETAPARADAEAALHLDPENQQAQNLLRVLGGSNQSTSQK